MARQDIHLFFYRRRAAQAALPHSDHLRARAGELQQTILDLHLKNPVEGKGPWLTVSMGGFSDLPVGASSWESMLSRADDALYLAKSRGKNCLVCAWDESSEGESAL